MFCRLEDLPISSWIPNHLHLNVLVISLPDHLRPVQSATFEWDRLSRCYNHILYPDGKKIIEKKKGIYVADDWKLFKNANLYYVRTSIIILRITYPYLG